jgi:hypothetical protein
LLPTAHARIRGPPYAGQSLPAAFRLQGLATLLTAYSLESRAGFVSHRQHSWDSPFGGLSLSEQALPAFPPEANLRTVDSAFNSAAEAPDRSDESRLPGSHLPRVPDDSRGFKPASRPRLPWVLPLQGLLRKPWPGFSLTSSHALRGPWRLLAEFAGASESRLAFAPPCPTNAPECTAGQGNPHGVLAPARSWAFGSAVSGLLVHLATGPALLPAHGSLFGHLAGTLP